MAEQHDWHDDAFEVYRLAWSELLQQWKPPVPADVEYYIEELKEALLDLKQAVLDENPVRALQYIDEVTLLVAELRCAPAVNRRVNKCPIDVTFPPRFPHRSLSICASASI